MRQSLFLSHTAILLTECATSCSSSVIWLESIFHGSLVFDIGRDIADLLPEKSEGIECACGDASGKYAARCTSRGEFYNLSDEDETNVKSQDKKISLTKNIYQMFQSYLQMICFSSRQEALAFYTHKMLFSSALFSHEILEAIAWHIVEICEQWHWI